MIIFDIVTRSTAASVYGLKWIMIMLILFQIGKSLDNMIQFIVFSAIDLALEYIDVINSIRNSSPPSSLKYLRPIGTRVETGGVRILFGGKSKTIRSSSAQIHTSVDNTLAHTVLGWALWCWEALYGNVVVAWLKYCYTQIWPRGLSPGLYSAEFCRILQKFQSAESAEVRGLTRDFFPDL